MKKKVMQKSYLKLSIGKNNVINDIIINHDVEKSIHIFS
jgi:hypothetical protein